MLAVLAALYLAGCAQTGEKPTEITARTGSEEPVWDPYYSNSPAGERHRPRSATPVARPAGKPIPATATDTRSAVRRHLPAGVADPEGWARDIATAFDALHITPDSGNICAVIAVTEQESSFQGDPPVAGLPRIVRTEIRDRARRYRIPETLLNLALSTKSPDGRSYAERITALRTENDLNTLYGDMTSELPLGRQLLADYNPVRTGGPMQVSLKFAETQVKESPYPYPLETSLREALFTRKGGLYFGIAYLLDYPTSYDRMLFRFADYNAGRYASRNAAFQAAVSRLTGQALDCDGDLLRYRDGRVAGEPSQTQQAVRTLAPVLGLMEEDIDLGLRREKSFEFETTPVYARVFAQAGQAGKPMPRAQLPEIKLNSPKITSGLTTAKFARRVNQRYQACLGRN